ncbi:MAG TPA: SpoIIE family protein phosphatase [Candidatus Acidoferrales bacterium]|nr:SpoIIE family protein phosphatase [Candidatus Acidoferrales bacterium]
MKLPVVEYGLAQLVLPGQSESGDRHLVCCKGRSALIAAIDGIGHGEEAANAAKAAVAVLESGVDEPVISLVERCHERLRRTRGVVLSLASVDMAHGMMTWLGVGNVQGVLLRAGARNGAAQEMLLLRGGVVGAQLPPLQAAVLPIACGDTLVFATDGVRSDFINGSSALESPQRAADRILERHHTGSDDGLVLVARLTGSHS